MAHIVLSWCAKFDKDKLPENPLHQFGMVVQHA